MTPFTPIVVYPAPSSYGSIAALSFQGVGIVARPLSEGVHVIHLYEPLIIPAGALIIRGGSPRVAILGADNKVRFKIVHLGRDYGATLEVVDGLSETDRLVMAHSDDLQEGQVVRALIGD